MLNKIKVLVADNRRDTRELIKTYLEKDRFIKVVGEAENGWQTLELTLQLKPDILLVYYNMNEVDGYEITEKVVSKLEHTIVIITSEKNDIDLVKKAMFHGAKEYIATPFVSETLINTIRLLYDKECVKNDSTKNNSQHTDINISSKVMSIFSTKGGVGKSTLAVNTALALYKKTKEKVAILDLDLQFGDVLLMVNKDPKDSIVDFIEKSDEYTLENLKLFMKDYDGISILPSPISPEYAEYVSQEHVTQIIKLLKQEYKYVIIDNPNSFDEVTLTALDASDTILMVTNMDIVSIKNVKLGLKIMDSLGYTEDKVKLVINKANPKFGIKLKDLKTVFEKKVTQVINEDIKTVVTSINKGIPFVSSFANSKISKTVYQLADQIK